LIRTLVKRVEIGQDSVNVVFRVDEIGFPPGNDPFKHIVGGVLSPVLANVVLDELDWELERRGHRFARYADDCIIVVKSQRAGERVMASVTRFVSDSLRLTVNPLKKRGGSPLEPQVPGLHGQP